MAPITPTAPPDEERSSFSPKQSPAKALERQQLFMKTVGMTEKESMSLEVTKGALQPLLVQCAV